MSFCLQCGAPVASEDRFCGNCGASVRPAGGAASVPQSDVMAAAAGASPSPGGGGGERAESQPADPSDAAPAEPGGYGNLQATLIESSSLQARPESTPSPSQPEESPARSEESRAKESSPFAPLPADEFASPVGAESVSPVDDSDEAKSTGETGNVGAVESTGEMPEENKPGTVAAPRLTDHDRTGLTGGGRRSQSKQLEPGTVLNSRYEIVRRIGGGGMGAVYYARDRNLGNAPRAVKEMIQSQLDESQHEKAISDFKRESMLLAELEHHSIPTIYDYFYDDAAGRFYLVMKYISGGDFLSRLRNAPGGRIDEQTVTDWAMQVADVLDYLHNRRPQIIYRDLKPANLMIDGNSGRVMLIDFGIARWVQKEEKGVTAVGTMGYAPPELFSGKVEPRSDLYSLGATMFHLLTGSDPQDNPLLIFDFTKNPRPRQLNPAISNEMERILIRATEHNVESRFRSAAELRDVLSVHLEKLRAGAVTYGAGTPQEQHVTKTTAVEMVYCGFCGGRIAADDVFCAHCGARQPLAGASAALRAARATAKLVVMGTTELDGAFQLHKESNLVGRSDPHSNIFPEIDLSKFDPETKISRRHARIFRQGELFLVEDLGSVNGTVINDSLRLAPRQPRVLESGDKLRLGETTLHFLIG